MAYRDHQVALAASLEAQHAKAALQINERDPLDKARQDFGLGVRLLGHLDRTHRFDRHAEQQRSGDPAPPLAGT